MLWCSEVRLLCAKRRLRRVTGPGLERYTHRPADGSDLPEARLLDATGFEVADVLVRDIPFGGSFQAFAAPFRAVVAPVSLEQPPEYAPPVLFSVGIHKAGLNTVTPCLVTFLPYEQKFLIHEHA